MPVIPTQVAFFRNLNLGHRGSPSRAELEQAFTSSDALNVRSYQTNGTVAFDAPDAPATLARVIATLTAACGWDDVAPVRPLALVREIAALPLPEPQLLTTHHVTLFDATLDQDSGWTTADGRLVVLARGPGWAACASRRVGGRIGDPTVVIQGLTGVRATTRTIGTIRRLVANLDARSS